MDGQYLIKFCLYYIIDKIYVFIEKGHFLQICNRVTALDSCQKLFFAQYLENGWTEFDQILFCIHITIDKVWVGIVFFFQFCNRATALDLYRNWCLLNILRMNGQSLTKF